MKKSFTNAAEELITGIAPTVFEEVSGEGDVSGSRGGAVRYLEPRSERMQLLLSKSLVKKLEEEAKKQKMSKNRLVNDILERYFSEE